MNPLESVLERNIAALDGNKATLLINPPTEYAGTLLAKREFPEIRHFSQYARSDLASAEFGLVPSAQVAQMVWFLPRERLLREWLAGALAHNAPPEGTLLAIGENQAGAKSAARQLGLAFGSVSKIDSARHCTAYLCREPLATDATDLPEATFTFRHAGVTLQAVTLPGVFSHGHLDHGTGLLLDNLPDDLEGDVLDFGCGCGIIAAAVAHASQCQLTASDISALALEATRRTFLRNDLSLPQFRLCSDLPEGRWDAIVTNPPFHDGIHTQYDTARRMIECAPDHLNKGGRLIIVANTHLGYPALMKARFGSVRILSQSRRFMVLEARL